MTHGEAMTRLTEIVMDHLQHLPPEEAGARLTALYNAMTQLCATTVLPSTFVPVAEERLFWNELLLADGSVLQYKVIPTRVWRSGVDVHGLPGYSFDFQTVLRVVPPGTREG